MREGRIGKLLSFITLKQSITRWSSTIRAAPPFLSPSAALRVRQPQEKIASKVLADGQKQEMVTGEVLADGLNQEKVAGEVLADGQNREKVAGEVLADGLNQEKVAGEVLADGLNREKVAGEVLAADYPCGLSQERGSSDEMTARYGGR